MYKGNACKVLLSSNKELKFHLESSSNSACKAKIILIVCGALSCRKSNIDVLVSGYQEGDIIVCGDFLEGLKVGMWCIQHVKTCGCKCNSLH